MGLQKTVAETLLAPDNQVAPELVFGGIKEGIRWVMWA